ncbi:hypothetical protein ACEQ8H_008028 [Pleosporales sp. CAS-2024a]
MGAEPATDRPITPPPQITYPLTPPPTGSVDKRDTFKKTKIITTKPRRSFQSKEGESLTEFFDGPQQGSDVELTLSDEDPISTNSSSTTPPVSDISFSPKCDLFQQLGILATTITPPAQSGPFRFLALPLIIRNMIYTHLVVVPGLIRPKQHYTISEASDSGSDQLYIQDRVLATGISSAQARVFVSGPDGPFSHFAYINMAILRVNKEVYAESRSVLYARSTFQLPRPSTELSPLCDFSVRLFLPACQRLVTKVRVCIRSFYGLHLLLTSGGNQIKNFYRGVKNIVLLLELQTLSGGFARKWSKQKGENQGSYVERLRQDIASEAFTNKEGKQIKAVPSWIHLRVLFAGETYDEMLRLKFGQPADHEKREELRTTLEKAWKSLKKGAR